MLALPSKSSTPRSTCLGFFFFFFFPPLFLIRRLRDAGTFSSSFFSSACLRESAEFRFRLFFLSHSAADMASDPSFLFFSACTLFSFSPLQFLERSVTIAEDVPLPFSPRYRNSLPSPFFSSLARRRQPAPLEQFLFSFPFPPFFPNTKVLLLISLLPRRKEDRELKHCRRRASFSRKEDNGPLPLP